MCGISGLATKRLGEVDLRATIERMANAIRHRGPDGMDVRCFEPPGISQRVALGHNRLAIIDVSQAGREPMTNEDGTVWLVFNGEIYNFPKMAFDKALEDGEEDEDENEQETEEMEGEEVTFKNIIYSSCNCNCNGLFGLLMKFVKLNKT